MTTSHARDSVAVLLVSVRRRWSARSWLQAALTAGTVFLATVSLLLLVDLTLPLGVGLRAGTRWLPPLAGMAAFIAVARHAGLLRKDRSAALFIEERVPSLQHLLTTLLEANLSTPMGLALGRRATGPVRQVRPAAIVPYRLARPTAWALGALGIAGVLVAATPGGAAGVWSRWLGLGTGSGGGTSAAGVVGPAAADAAALPSFTSVAVTLTPPDYTGVPSTQVPVDGVLPVLAGTAISVRAEATSGSIAAERVGVGTLPTHREGSATVARWVVTPADRGLDLVLRADIDGAAPADRRVIAISVLEDAPPTVTLEQPRRDLVVAGATGRVSVQARVSDDFGTADWALHWVRSSGSGESFSFEEGTWEWASVERRGDTLVGRLDLDLATTGLGPGDVLHLRAEAHDRNDVTGPGLGVSATRLLRVATPDALDQVTTLIGFPIEREREPLLSQRMIILLTEELLADADTLSAGAISARANAIADEQDRLRGRVEEVMFIREAAPDEEPAGEPPPRDPTAPPPALEAPGHDHDGSPIAEVNQDLVTAFNAMWDASRLLRQIEARASLTPQHLALDHLQKLREADRVFARGQVTRPPLDLGAARGSGEVDEARPVAREAQPHAADGTRWRGEIEAAAERLPGQPAAAVLALRALAASLLAAPDGSVAAAGLVTRAADRVGAADVQEARSILGEAARALTPSLPAGDAAAPATPLDLVGASYLERLSADPAPAPSRSRVSPAAPFVFATARYGSGDWDSAPLVPSNLIHSLVQYTNLPVQEEGAVVDLSSPELLRYPFVFLTGHLPLRLDDAESENVKRYVERGGFLFIDDHNHDIDGAFHRSVLSELARLFGSDAVQPLPNHHPLYRAFFPFEDGPPITGHELSGWGDGLIHRELFAIESDGRLGVLYSNKDYSSEWNFHAENKRFLALDSTRFGVNLILYALTR